MSEKFQPLDVAIPDEAGWKKKTLDELCSLISRGTAPVYVESSRVLAIGQRCVTSSQFAPEFARPHAERAMRNVLRPESGDVLLNSTGTGTIGRSVVFDHDGAFIVDGHVTVLRPKPEGADGRWLNAVLRTSWGQRHLERFCYAGSTNQLELSRTPVKASMLPVPSLAEQHAIAQVLDTIDTAIRETEALIDKLKAVKQGLLHDLLTRGIASNGQLRPPQSEAPQLYKDSPLGWIPKEWGQTSARDLCSLITKGTTPAAANMWQGGEGIRFLRVDNLSFDGCFDFEASDFRVSHRTHQGELSRSICLPGDVLTNIVGPPLGKLGLVTAQIGEVNINQAIALFRPRPNLLSGVLLLWLGSAPAQTWLRKRAKQTSGQVNLTLALCQELPIPEIPLEEQQLIVDRSAKIHEYLLMKARELDKLRSTKSGLMDDLLTGRVRVTPLLESEQETAAPTEA
jgi:type I restriction enzyme S subunit